MSQLLRVARIGSYRDPPEIAGAVDEDGVTRGRPLITGERQPRPVRGTAAWIEENAFLAGGHIITAKKGVGPIPGRPRSEVGDLLARGMPQHSSEVGGNFAPAEDLGGKTVRSGGRSRETCEDHQRHQRGSPEGSSGAGCSQTSAHVIWPGPPATPPDHSTLRSDPARRAPAPVARRAIRIWRQCHNGGLAVHKPG